MQTFPILANVDRLLIHPTINSPCLYKIGKETKGSKHEQEEKIDEVASGVDLQALMCCNVI